MDNYCFTALARNVINLEMETCEYKDICGLFTQFSGSEGTERGLSLVPLHKCKHSLWCFGIIFNRKFVQYLQYASSE